MIANTGPRVLLCDLNNFARYPTIPIGYLAAILRRAGMHVEVFSPLATGMTGVVREPPVRAWGLIDQRLRYWSAVSRSRLVRGAREQVRSTWNAPKLARHAVEVEDAVADRLREPFDAVLVSTYLMYYPHVARICRLCRERGLPVLVGGPYFAQPEVRREWLGLDGLTGLVGGEAELDAPQIVQAMIAGESLTGFPGLWQAPHAEGPPAPPLQCLDRLPFPDYSDFPWDRYPNRIIPVITGRGCGWGACSFCSDITSTAGRTFRSRSPDNVLAEIAHHRREHEVDRFVFTDLKINSDPAMWRALVDRLPEVAPGGQWIGSIHIDATREHGLSRAELGRAAAAGMVRLTTGLESGSQRVLDLMKKGTDLAVTSRVLHDAAEAGISVRVTMIVGYPGEEADDVILTVRFLEEHAGCIERVCLNRFAICTGTRVHRMIEAKPLQVPGVVNLTVNHREAMVTHHYEASESRLYRRAITRVLRVAHQINRRPLRETARAFEGVM